MKASEALLNFMFNLRDFIVSLFFQWKEKDFVPIHYVSRFYANPILGPIASHGWESYQIFNPGASICDDKIILFYRALGTDGVSRVGFAASCDGLHMNERLPYPIYEHGKSEKIFAYSGQSGGGWFGGAEDPRITYIEEDDTYYVAYTACDSILRVGYFAMAGEEVRNRTFAIKERGYLAPPKESKNWLLFPEKRDGRYMILHSLNPEPRIFYTDHIAYKEGDERDSIYSLNMIDKTRWDSVVRSGGAPPLRTKDGWLLFYHATNPKRGGQYLVGAMMLDYNNPEKVLYKSSQPILRPIEDYETTGYKGGIVYLSGSVIKDGMLFLYYGAADDKCAVAYANLDEFLCKLKENKEVYLKNTK